MVIGVLSISIHAKAHYLLESAHVIDKICKCIEDSIPHEADGFAVHSFHALLAEAEDMLDTRTLVFEFFLLTVSRRLLIFFPHTLRLMIRSFILSFLSTRFTPLPIYALSANRRPPGWYMRCNTNTLNIKT